MSKKPFNYQVYEICSFGITAQYDNASPTGRHHVVVCLTCDGDVIDTDMGIPVDAIEAHREWHKDNPELKKRSE